MRFLVSLGVALWACVLGFSPLGHGQEANCEKKSPVASPVPATVPLPPTAKSTASRPVPTAPQQILVRTKAIEIPVAKCESLGIDFQQVPGKSSPIKERIAPSHAGFKVIEKGNPFFAILEALQKDGLARVLSSPVLVIANGQAAHYHVGGEIPVVTVGPDGQTREDWRPYGTKLDIVPMLFENGRLQLHIWYDVSELEPAQTPGLPPAIRSLVAISTHVELSSGQTCLLNGPRQKRKTLQSEPGPSGAPKEVPREEDVVTLVLVTPELVTPELIAALASEGPSAASGSRQPTSRASAENPTERR